MATFAFNQLNQLASINQKNTADIVDIEELSNIDTKDGITVSIIESVYGGNATVFARLKVETEDIIFNDDFDYSFGLWVIKLNPNDAGKNLIHGGGTSTPVEQELWTEHIRYYDIKMSVKYGEWVGFDDKVDFSLGDGQERYILLEYFGYTNEKHEWVELSESEWKLKFSYYTDDRDIVIDFEKFMFYGKGLMDNNRLAQMTSIKLNKYGMECRYTALEIQEALDFTADIIMKDGTKITLIKKSTGCGINLEGFMTFKTSSALNLDEIAYIQIGDEFIAVN